ncbi:MAG: GNAT family N-acetyltransferase, partial [Ktedonobacteraceae bacterium]
VWTAERIRYTGNHRIPSSEYLANIFNEVATERLVLRRPRLTDGPAMFAIHGDPATNQYNPHGPDPDLATSEEALQDWCQHWEENGFGYWAVTLPQTENIIGFGGVTHIVWRERDILNLYYRFTPSSWGHGYAIELARTAVTLARKHIPQWPVIARTRAANIPSIRTAERSGLLRRPDLDTEHIVFALDWTPIETQKGYTNDND